MATRSIVWALVIGAAAAALLLVVYGLLQPEAKPGTTSLTIPPWTLALGLLFAPLAALWLTWRRQLQQLEQRNVEAMLENARAQIQQAELTLQSAAQDRQVAAEHNRLLAEGQLPERFSRAVDLLGHEKIEARLGGVYALELLGRDSQRDRPVVLETLAAFVRQNAPAPLVKDATGKRRIDFLPDDIQAALTVLGRRIVDVVGQRIDLASCNLRRARLDGANLVGFDLVRTSLARASLAEANLQRANLRYAELSGDLGGTDLDTTRVFDPAWLGADLSGADLRGAELCHADLRGARLTKALLGEIEPGQGADLFEADCRFADFRQADLSGAALVGVNARRADLIAARLIRSNLSKANLIEADLSNANLTDANLARADLRRAKLKNAVGLTAKQLEVAASYEDAELPDELKKALVKRKPLGTES
ncbi:MAG: pentapeptide repeat-containing protein [Deltaproteobacteria bacterium]|nr:pentapeptide repeat-containing protein [Deltaproteobacteria bacterium]